MTPIEYKSAFAESCCTNGIEYARILKNRGDEQGWGLVTGSRPIISMVTANNQENTAIYLLQSPTVVLHPTLNLYSRIVDNNTVVLQIMIHVYLKTEDSVMGDLGRRTLVRD